MPCRRSHARNHPCLPRRHRVGSDPPVRRRGAPRRSFNIARRCMHHRMSGLHRALRFSFYDLFAYPHCRHHHMPHALILSSTSALAHCYHRCYPICPMLLLCHPSSRVTGPSCCSVVLPRRNRNRAYLSSRARTAPSSTTHKCTNTMYLYSGSMNI